MADTPSQKAMLNAAQIFGYAGNLFSAAAQDVAIRAGTKADQAAIGVRLKQETLQLSQQSVEASKQLESVLASQRALFAARGQAAGTGTAKALGQKSINAFAQEEANRAIIGDYNAYRARAEQTLLKAKQAGASVSIYNDATNNMFRNTSFNDLFKDKAKAP